MKKLFNYMLVIGLTFMASIGLAKAADYDLSFKFYELNVMPNKFVSDVYDTGAAVEIDPLKLKAGQEFALAVYSKSNTGLAEGFNIDVIWDDSVLEPWKSASGNTYASADLSKVYPTYYDEDYEETVNYWSGDRNFRTVNYYKTVGDMNIPSVTAGFSTSDGSIARLTQSGPLFFLYFKVKDNATPGTGFDFTISPKSKFVSNEGESTLKFSVEYANCLVDSSNPEEELIIKGDVNSNGRVDIGDVMLVNAYALKQKTPNDKQFAAADVNNDGKINITDSMRINFYVLGTITEL